MAITTVQNELIAVNAISGTVIADNAITSVHIAQNQVTATQIPAGSIVTAQLAADAVSGAKLADSSVVTANIQDDQVTLAKMAGLARGAIIIGNSSSNPTQLTIGSNDYVLTSDGTDLAWEAAGGGGAISALNNATANELVTVGSTTTELDAESNLTFDGTTLVATGSSDGALVPLQVANTVQGGTNDTVAIELQLAGSSGQVAAGTLIAGKTEDWTSGTSRSGYLAIQAVLDGTNTEMARFGSTGDGTKAISFSNADVGIGTTSPSEKLHVLAATGDAVKIMIQSSGTATTDDVQLQMTNHQADWSLGIDQSSGGKYKISRHEGLGNYDYLTIDTNGKVNLGDAVGAYTFAEKLVVGDGDTNDGITIQSGSTHQGNLAFNKAGGTTAHGRILYQHNTNYMSFFTNNAERMRIENDGIVHICPSTLIAPTIKHGGAMGALSKLRLINRHGQGADKGGLIEFGGVTDDGVSRSDVFGAVGAFKTNSTSANRTGYLAFYTNDGDSIDERMRITAGGTVMFNDTTAYGTDGNNVLNINFSGARKFVTYENSVGSDQEVTPARFYNWSAGEAGAITYTYGSVNYGSASDYRMKENVVDVTNATSVLKQLRPVNFQWIDDPDRTTAWGFLAHEAQAVFPTAVRGTKDAMREDDPEKIDTQQMDHSKLVPLLVATIQELETRLEALESE